MEWQWKCGPLSTCGAFQGEPSPNRIMWFRLFGYGLQFKDRKCHPPLFSERYGYRKFVYVGRLAIGFMKPERRF